MQEFVFFLGRFHVLALHLPVGIVVAAVVLDALARRKRFGALGAASPFLWGAAAISAIVTVVLGLLHYAEGSFSGPSADSHRFFGIVTAVAACFAWWVADKTVARDGIRLGMGVVVLLFISLTGHYGGNLTHGSAFLLEYAPAPFRALLGTEDKRARPASVAAADPYFDVVAPLLELRCGGCHNDDKRSGGFSMATYDFLLVGGDTGRAIVPGNVDASELLYRVSLPPDDEAFMPAEGKAPLTPSQVAIVRWWVGAGAPRDTTVAALGGAGDVEPLLAAELGLGASAAPTPARGQGASATADAALIDALFATGFLVRQVSAEDAGLVVSVNSPGEAVGADALAVLARAAETLIDVNLASAQLDDGALASLGTLPFVTHLRIARNALTDMSLAHLPAQMPRLRYLDLYGNGGVTDAGLDAIASLAELREVYLWQTAVTSAGAAGLHERRPDLAVEMGSAAVLARGAAPFQTN